MRWKTSLWFRGPTFAVYREGRFIIAELDGPHRALSTSPRVGGLTPLVTHLVNHQSCEGSEHLDRHSAITALGPEGYHDSVCAELALEAEKNAVMGTAANMIYAAHESASFGETRVDAIVTAGVEGNAACAGDPARWVETPSGWNAEAQVAGTINTMAIVNQPLRPEAQIRAALTVTEAKTAALVELGVSSRYSAELATGTGTDQIALAAPIADRYAYSWTGTQSKLGELFGAAVRNATKQALRWQNGLEPSLTRSLFHALRRFGLTEAGFIEALRSRLDAPAFRLLEKNKNAVFYEPQAAAAAYAFGSVLDRARYGVISGPAAREALRQQAATMAAALAAHPESWSVYWRRLDVHMDAPLNAVYDAIALGWSGKWLRPD
jgi:adenosylcobinamide amidohydrolase